MLKAILATALVAVSLASTQAFALGYDISGTTNVAYNVRTYDSGANFSKTIILNVGRYWTTANVQLRGFDLDFLRDDRHLDRIRVQIKNKVYNPGTGYVAFTIEGWYGDQHPVEDFYYDIGYTVLMLD